MVGADNIVRKYIDEMLFEYKNNMLVYNYDKESIDRRLNYTDDGPFKWDEMTNFLINISHVLLNLSESQLHICLSHCILKGEVKDKRHSFLLSSAYGYFAYRYSKTVNECIRLKKIKPLDVYASLHFHDAARILAQMQICRWWDESDALGNDILDAINNYEKDSDNLEITENGIRVNPISWFIVDLFVLASGGWYIEKKANHPNKKEYKLYQRVLDNWDTKDLKEVEKLNFILCEVHLIELENKSIVHRQMDDILSGSIEHAMDIIANTVKVGSNDDFAPRELEDLSVKIFPYEIFSWLKLRERAGIKNPKTFTHPLMNTPIAKMFLGLKEPLAKPTKLPYAKELLEKLKEKCTDVEIPEWLDSEDTPNIPTEKETQPQNNDTIPDDFMK